MCLPNTLRRSNCEILLFCLVVVIVLDLHFFFWQSSRNLTLYFFDVGSFLISLMWLALMGWYFNVMWHVNMFLMNQYKFYLKHHRQYHLFINLVKRYSHKRVENKDCLGIVLYFLSICFSIESVQLGIVWIMYFCSIMFQSWRIAILIILMCTYYFAHTYSFASVSVLMFIQTVIKCASRWSDIPMSM